MEAPRTDLDRALDFVIRRISEEAHREGHPLLESERDFLHHLPKRPTNPTLHSGYSPADLGVGALPLRDFSFERLCSLAKNAYTYEITKNPETHRQWNFAIAVFNLNNHPMSWLLRWAGLKGKKAGAVTDGCLLLISGVAVVGLMIALVFAFLYLAPNDRQPQQVTLWIAGGSLFLAIAFAVHLLTSRLEKWQGERTVEKYRCDLDDRPGFMG